MPVFKSERRGCGTGGRELGHSVEVVCSKDCFLTRERKNMMKSPRNCRVSLVAILLFTQSACDLSPSDNRAAPPAAPSIVGIQPPHQILFIGNSFTYFNGGIDQHLFQLAASHNPPLPLNVASQTFPDQNLKGHYRAQATKKALHQQQWDVVILQGYGTEPIHDLRQEEFREFAQLLDREIQRAGAKTVFFMTWAYRNKPKMTEQLRNAYVTSGNALEALVVPVGLAWERVLRARPTAFLYSDAIHPTLQGTYLSACIFYASLFGESPVGLSYTAGIAEEDALFLQRIAWETTRSFFGK